MGNIGEITEVKIEEKIREIVTEIFENYTVQASQISPSGIDSSPLKEKQGVILPVGGSGKFVHIGTYTDNQVDEGEIKVYSEDADANIVASIYLDKDGNIHIDADTEIIINGGEDYAVKYNELETAFNQLKDDFDNHTHSIASNTFVVSVSGQATGTLNPAPIDVQTTTASTADITPAKVDEVRI